MSCINYECNCLNRQIIHPNHSSIVNTLWCKSGLKIILFIIYSEFGQTKHECFSCKCPFNDKHEDMFPWTYRPIYRYELKWASSPWQSSLTLTKPRDVGRGYCQLWQIVHAYHAVKRFFVCSVDNKTWNWPRAACTGLTISQGTRFKHYSLDYVVPKSLVNTEAHISLTWPWPLTVGPCIA